MKKNKQNYYWFIDVKTGSQKCLMRQRQFTSTEKEHSNALSGLQKSAVCVYSTFSSDLTSVIELDQRQSMLSGLLCNYKGS